MNFSQNLKALREVKGLSQADLARVLGVCRSAVNKYEKSLEYPTCKGLCALADYFQVTTDQLLGRESVHHTDEEGETGTVKVEIQGSSEEIAALVVAIQERQVDTDSLMFRLQQFLTEECKRDHSHT